MKRAAFLALLFTLPITAFAASSPTQAVIVMTKPTGHLTARSLSASFDPSVSEDERDIREFTGIHGFAANLTADEIASLKASGNVIFIEPDFERHALTDTITAGQQTTPYGVTAVDAPPVWPVTRGKSLSNGPAIHVAIIDTGIDYSHPELAGAFKEGFNYITRTTDPFDDNGHGTHVAGTIAAANDGAGVVGIASDVDLYSLKVLDACGSGRTSDIIQAVDWVVQKKKAIGGNWIINLSLGSDTPSTTEQAEFQTASDAGILVFAAAGNSYSGTDGLSYPAGYPTVVSVGAVDSTNLIADFSQRGPDLKLVAPGVGVLSTHSDGGVKQTTGPTLLARFAEAIDSSGNPVCLSNAAATGKVVVAGTGLPSEYPAGSAGKIALVQRGGTDPGNIADPTSFTFFAKSKYAKSAGATALIVVNIIDPATSLPKALVQPAFVSVAQSDLTKVVTTALVSIEDGASLKTSAGSTITLEFDSAVHTQFYDTFDGTSMATPHAVGSAALVWATSPNSTAGNVTTALEQTAKDLGAPGQDTTYGFGLVDAYAAARLLNPAAFSTPVKGRYAGRRGH
jgi:serine protease